MTEREFDAACKRRGFVPEGFLGYYRLPSGASASILNAGDSPRAQLAYLIETDRKWAESKEREILARMKVAQ